MGVELIKFVPLDINTFPDVLAVAGIVAVDQVGSAEFPPDNRN